MAYFNGILFENVKVEEVEEKILKSRGRKRNICAHVDKA